MTYYVDFDGWCEIEANSPEEAEEKFWNTIQKPCTVCKKDAYDIEGIELKEEA